MAEEYISLGSLPEESEYVSLGSFSSEPEYVSLGSLDEVGIAEQAGAAVGLNLAQAGAASQLPIQPMASDSEPGILEQLLQIPKLVRATGAETGLTTAGGLLGRRAAGLEDVVIPPPKGASAGYRPFGGTETQEEMLTRMKGEARTGESEFLEAAKAVPEDYGLDPNLDSGVITQASRGLTKGAGMLAVAAAGGIPALAIQGSTEAYGAAKAEGKTDDEADKQATRSLIGLAIFGGANKAVASGLAARLGNASQLKTFLVQALGQSAGNEITSRAISAYEAALDAEPGTRMDKAVEALTENNPETIAQNLGFGLLGGLHATGRANAKARNENRLTQVEQENIARAEAERLRTEQIISEQNAEAARLGEQRQAQGVQAGPEVAPEALTPEQRVRAEATPSEPIVTGAPVAPTQQGQREDITMDPETGFLRDSEGNAYKVGEFGFERVVEGSPEAVSQAILEVPKPPAAKEAIPVAAAAKVITPAGIIETQPTYEKGQPRILSTALKGENGELITGRSATEPHLGIYQDDIPGRAAIPKENQGYMIVDAEGNVRFADRIEAGNIAVDSGILPQFKKGESLISEHLRGEVKDQVPPSAESRAKLEEDFTDYQKRGSAPKEAAPESGAPPEPPPVEPPVTPEDRGRPPLEGPTSLRKAQIDLDREAQGLPPREAIARKEFGATWEEANRIASETPDAGSALVSELNQTPRALNPTEKAVLLHEKITREDAYNRALDAVNKATDEGSRRTAENALTRARERNQEIYDAAQKGGTAAGQSLAFQKLMAERDYSLGSMVAEAIALKKPRTPEEVKKLEAQVQEMHTRIKAAEERAEKAETQLIDQKTKEEVAKLFKAAKVERSEATKQGKSILDRIISNGDEARARIKKRNQGRSMMSATIIDPVDFIDYIQVGAGYLARGVKGIGEFTKSLVDDFGPGVEPNANKIFEASTRYHEESVGASPKVKTVEDALAKDKAGALNQEVVYETARAHVNSGVQGYNEVIKSTHQSLLKNHPDITELDVKHVLSGYGKRTTPSQEADRKTLREYKRLAMLDSAIEDAIRKIKPLKSGPQRDKATEAIRVKMAELRKAMDDAGIETTSPENQLASRTQSAVTRLTNRKESLQRQIAAKQRDEVTKGKTVDTPEIRKLKDEVGQLNDLLDKVSPKTGETEAQKLQKLEANAEKRLAELDEQLRTGKIDREGKPTGLTSPKLERTRAEIEAMTVLRNELRYARAGKLSPDQRKINNALKSIDRQIAELDRQLKAGDLQVKGAQRQVSTPELDRKRAERDAMVELKSELRNLSKPKADPEAAKIKAVQKSLELIEQEILTGTRAARATRSTAASEQLQALRSERDQMRMHLNEIRNAAKVRKSPEEIALQRYKSSLNTRTKALEDRIKRGDYEKKTRKETVLDKEALDARFQYQKAKDTFEKELFKYDLARRGKLQRSYDALTEGINTSRAIMTSFDVSAPLRQGAFITLAHPFRSAKSVGKMFKSLVSEKQTFKMQESLMGEGDNPNPNAALYRQAGLDLTETGTVTRRKLEENFQTRHAEKIWGVKHSQRAYVTFLNQLRADSFDAMVRGLSRNGKTVSDMEAKAIANFINIATGRGKYPQKMENATHFLNTFFFAPKYVASRFQLALDPLTGFSITSGIPFTERSANRVRKQVALEYARFLMGAGVALGLAKMAGADIETDPDSPDFAKPKFGNTRLDPFGGLVQTSRLLLDTGEVGKTTLQDAAERATGMQILGEPTEEGMEKRGKYFERLTKFGRQKLSPFPGTTIDIATGKDVVGNVVSPTGAILDMATPLTFGDIMEALLEQGAPKGMALSLVSAFGASMSTYEDGAKKEEANPFGTYGDIYNVMTGGEPVR